MIHDEDKGTTRWQPRDDLECAIAEPARVAGHALDPATVGRIVDQVVDENAVLPLIQFALERIWDGMRDGTAPSVTLTALGVVGGALAQRADEILAGLSESSRRLAEQVFLACVHLGDTARDTRQRVWLNEITPAGVPSEVSQRELDPR